MANRELSVRIRADDQASAIFDKVGNSAQTMGQMIERAGESGAGLQTLSQQVKALDGELKEVGTSLTAAGAVGAGIFGLAARESMQFTSAMANVNSIARATTGELDAMSDAVLSMATRVGAAPETLAAGLYDIVSSGIPAAEALEVLEAAAVAAGAGLTTTDVSARAITATLNAYQMSADKAGDVSDVLFKIVDSGVITFEALANNLGNTLPLAASLGVEIQELGAAYAQLTLSGISASLAETQIAGLMRSALNPTEALTQAVTEYGYASAEALINAEGLAGYLAVLMDASGGTSAALMDLVGTQEAMNAALVLSRGEGEAFAAMIEEMGGAAQDGAYTLEVFGVQMDNAAGAARLAAAEFQAATINIGQGLEPLVAFGAETVAAVVGAFNDLPPAAHQAIAVIGATGAAATLAAGSFMLLLPRVVEFHNAMVALGGVRGIVGILGRGLGGLALRINPVVAGLGVLAAGGVAVYRSFQSQKEAAEDYIGSLETLDDVLEQIRLRGDEGLANIGDNIRTEIDRLTALLYDAEQGPLTFFEDMNLAAQGVDPTWFSNILEQDFNRAYELADQLNLRIAEALQNPDVDQEGYVRWVQDMLKTVEITAEGSNIDEVFAEILNRPLSDFSEAAADATMSASEFANEMARLRTILEGGAPVTVNEFATAITTLDEAIKNGEVSRRLVSEWMDDLDRQMATGAISYAQYQEQVTQGAQDLDRFAASQKGLAGDTEETTAKLADFAARLGDASATIQEIMGLGDPLSQWNLAAAASDAALLAEHLTDAAAASEGVFRVIVGNTDAIKQHADAVLSWAEGLIDERGVFSRLDELVNAGLITGTSGKFDDGSQYAEAQNAYDSIAASVGRIGDNLDAVQAIQAPLMAAMLEDTAAYTDELREMDAAQQLVALGWMDSATSARAMEIATLGAAAAAGELGANGEEAFAAMVEGAAAADPVLKALLVDMGIIEEGAHGEITVNTEGLEGARTTLADINATLADLIDILDDDVLNGSYKLKIDTEVEPPVVPDPVGGAVPGSGGYTGGRMENGVWVPGWTIKPEAEAPEFPDFTIPQPDPVPIQLDPPAEFPDYTIPQPDPITPEVIPDTGAATTHLNAYEPPTVRVPVEMALTFPDHTIPQPGDFETGGGGDRYGIPETITVTINAQDNASAVILDVGSLLGGLDAGSATPHIYADESEAMTSIGAVGHNLAVLDGATAQVNVVGDNSGAMAAIGEVQGYNGDVIATAYVNIVARDLTGGITRASGGMLPGYAAGGVLFQAAEVGPEVAHFASGGTALLTQPGLYYGAPGTYIAPNNTLPGGGDGGLTVYAPITVEGSVFGIDDLIEASTRAIAPAMGEVAKRAMREQGVTL